MAHISQGTGIPPNGHPTAEAVLSMLVDGVAYYDEHAKFVFCNPRYSKLLRLDQAFLQEGVSWRSVAHLRKEQCATPMPLRPENGSRDQGPIEYHLDIESWRRLEWRPMPGGGFLEICTDITELKRRENLLQRHETIIQTAEKLAHLGYFVMNPETLETTYLSSGILEIAPSLEPDEGSVSYGSLIDRVHPDDREEVATKTMDAIQNGTSIMLEFRALTQTGDIQNLWLSNAEVFDIDLAKTVRVGMVQDITDRVTKEAEGREHEALRHAITDSALDCVVTVDATGVIREFNPAAEMTFGHTRAEAMGEVFSEMIVPPHLREEYTNGTERYLSADRQDALHRRVEITAQHADGHLFPIELAITPVEVNEQQFFTVYLRDISARVAADKSLQESARNLQAAQRIAGVGSWELDGCKGACTWSDELYTIYGIENGTVEPSREMMMSMVPMDQRSEVQALIQYHVDRIVPFEVNHTIVRKTGELRYVSARGEPQLAQDGSLLKYVGTIQDQTDLRRSQEELQLAKEEAEAASEAKSDFLAMMSHEIRTPLNGVLGTLRVLGQSRLDDDQRSLIRLATSSGETLNLMLSDALDFAKIEAGRLELEAVPYRPGLLISDIAEFWRPVVEGKGLEFHVTLQPNMPEVVIGDTGRIRQILNNFLSNAAKFTDIGCIKVELGVEPAADGGNCLSLAVVDTGQGISDADTSNVFLEFRQLGHHDHERRGGTGLGLAICRKLSEMMGGSVSFQSEPGKGSLFKCVLPLQLGSTDMLPVESENVPHSQKQLQTTAGTVPNVLVVEDNATNQIVASRLLLNMGCRVDCVDDGRQAIEAVARRNYDVILMDINMPVMGGLEATERLRALPTIGPKLRIIALTAYAMDKDIQSVKKAGMDGFVSKPIIGNQLYRALETALKNTEPHVAVQGGGSANEQAEAAIQRETLDELLDEFSPEVQQRLVLSICSDVTKAANAIVRAVQEKDLTEVERRSHTLKGVSGTFGAFALQAQAEDMNVQCRHHKRLPTIQEAQKVLVASKDALQELEHILTTSQGAAE